MNDLLFGPASHIDSYFAGLPLSGPVTALFGATEIAEHRAGHTGLDIAAPVGTGVLAPADGVVLEAAASSGVFGSYVEVLHRGGYRSLFAHLSRLDVAAGQQVRRGDGLGLVGVTGLTTGPHLHWGVALGASPAVRGAHLRDPLAHIGVAAGQPDRERLLRGVALGVMGALQCAGASFGTETAEDFAIYAEESPERDVLAIQLAANRLIARYG